MKGNVKSIENKQKVWDKKFINQNILASTQAGI